MADFSMLESVKESLGLSGNDFHDGVLQQHIDEVTEYLIDGGVPEAIASSRRCKGIVARGVSDLWNNGSGGTDLSPYFTKRAAQLALKWGANSGQT